MSGFTLSSFLLSFLDSPCFEFGVSIILCWSDTAVRVGDSMTFNDLVRTESREIL